jgi:Arc/MetJ-type ribon-helix-helix transcriptional regulator
MKNLRYHHSKRVRRMARPKSSRKTYPHSFALTLEQGEFLRQFPNSSEYVRRLLDGIIAERDDIEARFLSLTLKHKIELLRKEIEKTLVEKEQCRLEHIGEFIKEKITGAAFVAILAPYEKKVAFLEGRIKELEEKLEKTKP